MLGSGLAVSANAQAAERHTLFDRFHTIDISFVDAAQIATAREAFEAVVRRAASCGARDVPAADRASCLVGSVFASGQLTVVAEPGGPESSTVTSALVSHRGNCAALSALALAVAERVKIPLEAVVFPRHVVVRAPGEPDQAFELLQRGSQLTMAQVRKRLGPDGKHETRVRADDFPIYYLDNLAVRFAEAGDSDRAEGMFEKAIEAGPRIARIRFNYGTYLLGKERLGPAEKQLRRAVHLDSHNAPAWANLGVVIARRGVAADARRCFERALHEDPGNRTARENLKALGSVGPPSPR
jgi:tetratricopeptide (TPR) repeat protein